MYAARAATALLGALALAACGGGQRSNGDTADAAGDDGGTLVVFNAGSLARPLRAALISFAVTRGTHVMQENAGSLETARKLTELHRIPDIIALADDEIFPKVLMPSQTSWYVQFARNRMVIAYTDRSRGASEIDSTNWWRIVQRPGVEVGRSDPALDPAGYRTLLTFQLAERYYHQPGLAAQLLAASPARNVRPKSADLVGLLQAGELDYIWSYESVAQAAGLRAVRLPSAIDLSSPGDSATYAMASVRVPGRTPGDTVEMRGQPIIFAFSIPTHAPHPAVARAFAAFLLSDRGKAILRAERLDVLDEPILIGSGAPAEIVSATATPAATP
ncbi:MAG TPA: extracellular solute-binding protein [Gemmatimonadaceae bacterium]|nr:extracellular solute-binding protein [Gemmatimonadaceae bacterium]